MVATVNGFVSESQLKRPRMQETCPTYMGHATRRQRRCRRRHPAMTSQSPACRPIRLPQMKITAHPVADKSMARPCNELRLSRHQR